MRKNDSTKIGGKRNNNNKMWINTKFYLSFMKIENNFIALTAIFLFVYISIH